MPSKGIQCGFESHPGHFTFDSKVTNRSAIFIIQGAAPSNAPCIPPFPPKLDRMYDLETRTRALAPVAQGRSLNSVSKQTGISRFAIRSWQVRINPHKATTTCKRCDPSPSLPQSTADYVYLLEVSTSATVASARVHAVATTCESPALMPGPV